jgi:Uri superfamily endonuclease
LITTIDRGLYSYIKSAVDCCRVRFYRYLVRIRIAAEVVRPVLPERVSHGG